MRTQTIVKEIYTFDELSDEAKQAAIEWYRSGDEFEFAAESVIDDCKEIASLIGIDTDHIYYSGFCSQGDGACFTGDYRYKKGALKAVMCYAPLDTKLHGVVKQLQAIQARHFYSLTASVAHRGHCYHEFCTDIDVNDKRDIDVSPDTESDLKDTLRYFMQWIYSRLESEYEYIQSYEYCIEGIQANEYEFYGNGSVA